MTAYVCTCGYVAASDGELGDHWGEAFIPPDDRDASGAAHAEAVRDDAASVSGMGSTGTPIASGGDERDMAMRLRCLCGDAFDLLIELDEHLLRVFTPTDRVGLDGLPHAPAA